MLSVDIIFKIAGIGVLVAVIATVLKRADRDDIANLIQLTGLVVTLLIVVDLISELFDTIKDLFFF